MLPNTIYEVRARLISNLTPKSSWSLWLTVTTPDTRLGWSDLEESIEDAVQAAQDTSDQVAADIQAEVARAQAVEAQIQLAVDAVEAEVVVVQGEVDDAQTAITTEIASVRADMATEIDQVYIDFQAGDEGIQQQVNLIALQVNNSSYIRKTDADDGSVGLWTALTGGTAPISNSSVPAGQTGNSVMVYTPGAFEQPYYSGVNINGTTFRIRGWVNVAPGETARVAIIGSTLGNGPGGEEILAQSDEFSGSWQQIDMTFTVGVDTEEWAPAFLVSGGVMRFWRVRLEDYSAAANLEASIQANAQAIIDEASARVQMGTDITAAYQDADNSLQAGITSNTVAISDEKSARIAAIERLEARSGDASNLIQKSDYSDGSIGDWIIVEGLPSANVTTSTAGPTQMLVGDRTIMFEDSLSPTAIRAVEGTFRPGDIGGKSFTLTGHVRTGIGLARTQLGIEIERADGSTQVYAATIRAEGISQAWVEFSEELSIPDDKTTAWRPTVLLSDSTANLNRSFLWAPRIELVDGAAMAAVQQEALARATEDTALAGRIDTVEATAGDNTAAITQEVIARTDADNALATQITTLGAEVDGNTAAISSEAVARADADSALSGRIDTVEATADDNTAAISQEAVARANADSAMAADISGLGTAVDGNKAAITAEALARSNADSALASQITLLESNTSGLLNNRTDFEDGSKGEWTGGAVTSVVPITGETWKNAMRIDSGATAENPIRPGNIRGRVIRIRGRAHTNASDRELRVGIQRFNGNVSQGAATVKAIDAGLLWTDFDVKLVIADTTDTTGWRPYIGHGGGSASYNAYVAWIEFIDITDAAEAQATASSALTVATDAEQALATMNTTINAQYGSLSAFVEDTATAIVDQDGFAAAYFGITAEIAGGDIVGLKGTTWEDPNGNSHSLLKLIGDNVVVPGSLSAFMLSIHDPDNLIPDNQIQSNTAWNLPTSWYSRGNVGSPFNSLGAIRYTHSGGDGWTAYGSSRDFSAEQFKQYHFEMRVVRIGTNNNSSRVHYRVVWQDSAGANFKIDSISNYTGVGLTTGVVAAPAGAKKGFIQYAVNRTDTQGDLWIGDFIARAKNPGSVLLTPQSITAPLLTTDELITNTAQLGDAIITRAKIGGNQIYADYFFEYPDNRLSGRPKTNPVRLARQVIAGFEGGGFTAVFSCYSDNTFTVDSFGSAYMTVDGVVVDRQRFGVRAGATADVKAIFPVLLTGFAEAKANVVIEVYAYNSHWDSDDYPSNDFDLVNQSLLVSGCRR